MMLPGGRFAVWGVFGEMYIAVSRHASYILLYGFVFKICV